MVRFSGTCLPCDLSYGESSAHFTCVVPAAFAERHCEGLRIRGMCNPCVMMPPPPPRFGADYDQEQMDRVVTQVCCVVCCVGLTLWPSSPLPCTITARYWHSAG